MKKCITSHHLLLSRLQGLPQQQEGKSSCRIQQPPTEVFPKDSMTSEVRISCAGSFGCSYSLKLAVRASSPRYTGDPASGGEISGLVVQPLEAGHSTGPGHLPVPHLLGVRTRPLTSAQLLHISFSGQSGLL